MSYDVEQVLRSLLWCYGDAKMYLVSGDAKSYSLLIGEYWREVQEKCSSKIVDPILPYGRRV